LTGLLVAPAIWPLLALGQEWSARTTQRWEQSQAYETTALLPAAGCLIAAALLVSLLLWPGVSPAGSLTAGVLLLAPATLMFVTPLALADPLDAATILGHAIPLRTPLHNGSLLVVAVMLVAGSCQPSRWRTRAPKPAAAPTAAAVPLAKRDPNQARFVPEPPPAEHSDAITGTIVDGPPPATEPGSLGARLAESLRSPHS